ncbi:hypothetical protein BVX97_05435 [bacterium E08(2017)]|nr:hypothetical protein BVX97_05435 [bacterium E08(2017)]
MSDEQIIARMVKGRECCRQLVKAFETARARDREVKADDDNVSMLANADMTLSRMLTHLAELPDKLGDSVSEVENREYAMRLLGEIAELLQRAMILERELRNAKMNYPHLSGGPEQVNHPSIVKRAYAA